MNTNTYNLRQSTIMVLAALMTAFSSPLAADDTEIYFSSSGTGGVQSNVLFNLDTSGSMSSKVDENNNGTIDSGERSRIEVMKEALIDVIGGLTNVNAGLMRYHYQGGPILYPVADVNEDACVIEGTCSSGSGGGGPTGIQTTAKPLAANNDDGIEDALGAVNLSGSSLQIGDAAICAGETTLNVRVSTGRDDVEQQGTGNSGSVNDTSTDLEFTADGSTQQTIGIRFINIGLPQNVLVTNATITFEVDEAGSGGPFDVDIWGVAENDAGTPDTTSPRPDMRPKTTAMVVWNGSDDPPVNDDLFTPNLAPILQQLSCRGAGTTSNCPVAIAGDWDAGHNAMFVMKKSAGSTNNGRRTVESYNGESANAPLLSVTYCTAITASTIGTGLRFSGLSIPHGSTITTATIDLTALAADTSTPSFRIRMNDVDNAAAFTAGAGSDMSGRTFVTTGATPTATFTPGSWVTDTAYSSTDLKDMVQEVVNRTGWCGGNSMMFYVDENGASTGKRVAYSKEGDGSKAPILNISYDADNPQTGATGCSTSTVVAQVATGSDDAEEHATGVIDLTSTDLELVEESDTQVIGMRFKNIPIAKSTVIVSAKLTFGVDETASGATTLTIKGQLSPDASTFSSTANDITNSTTRPRTTAANDVTWSTGSTPPLVGWSTVGNQHDTPDLKAIIQEIVNQGTWAAGNALALFVSGSGKRVAESFNGDPGLAPKLTIEIQGDPTIVTVTVRKRLQDLVSELVQRGGTPILGSVVEAANYYRGEAVHFGLKRGTKSSSDRYTRVSHKASYTANGATETFPGACTAGNLNDSDCRNQIISGGNPIYKSPIEHSCQQNYLINLTDGGGYYTDDEQTHTNAYSAEDENGNAVSMSSCSSSVDLGGGDIYNGGSHNNCVVSLVKFLNENDQLYTSTQNLASGTAPVAGMNPITTYGIGFNLCGSGKVIGKNSSGDEVCCSAGNVNGAGLCSSPLSDPSTINFMKKMSKAGGGFYRNANNAQELTDAFNAILGDIKDDTTSFAAPAIATNFFNQARSRDEIYFGLFTPDEKKRWNGNVKRYRICIDDDTVDAVTSQACSTAQVSAITVLDQNHLEPVDSATGLIKSTAFSYWSSTADGADIMAGGAGGEITDYTARIIYTDESSTGLPGTATALDTDGFKLTSSNWSSVSGPNLTHIHDAVCDVPGTLTAGSECENKMLWLVGKDILDEDTDGSTTDTRWGFGDVIHSSPQLITYGFVDSIINLDTNSSGSPDSVNGLPDIGEVLVDKLLVSTNDGALRMINSVTGVEEWRFMPQSTLSNTTSLYTNLEGDHIYGMDSTPVIRITDQNKNGIIEPDSVTPANGDSVYLYQTMRRGGNSIYALDITPASTLTSPSSTVVPKIRWRISGGSGDYVRMGDTWSRPVFATINVLSSGSLVAKEVMIVGGGYDKRLDDNFGVTGTAPDANLGNAIYIIDPDDGSMLLSISHKADGASVTTSSGADIEIAGFNHSVTSDIRTVDSDTDGKVDRLYFSDIGGNVWRVDLGNDINADNSIALDGSATQPTNVGLLASMATSGTVAAERRFFNDIVAVSVIDKVYTDTSTATDNSSGKFTYVLLTSGYRAHPLDLAVSDRYYALRDKVINRMTVSGSDRTADGVGFSSPITESDLASITTAALTNSAGSNSAFNKRGYFMDFPDSGEKGLSSILVLFGNVFFTTYSPSASAPTNACSANIGQSFGYILGLATGAGVIDWDASGGIDESDRRSALGSGLASTPLPIFTEQGVGVASGIGGTLEDLGQISANKIVRTYWYEQKAQ